MYKQTNQRGFTIVELLIVIVVIGILAAITIVAYNGIQKRAQGAAASSALTQAAKKLTIAQVDNSNTATSPTCAEFYTTLTTKTDLTGAAACSFSISNINYQYKQTPTIPPYTGYCITATNGSTSYTLTNSSTPTPGSCGGHGGGGVAAITNLAINPSAESDSAGTQSVGSNTATINRVTDTKRSGSGGFKAVANGVSAGFTHNVSINGGTQFRYSAYLYATNSVTVSMYGQTYVGGTYAGLSPQSGNTSVTLASNTWTRVSWTGSQSNGATTASLGFLIAGGTGQTVYIDDVMITSGLSDYLYADGSSPGWDWTGAVNSSTSSGPPLL